MGMNNEPVAWMHKESGQVFAGIGKPTTPNDFIPLYTHPHPDNLGLALSIIDQQNLEIERLKASNEILKTELINTDMGYK